MIMAVWVSQTVCIQIDNRLDERDESWSILGTRDENNLKKSINFDSLV